MTKEQPKVHLIADEGIGGVQREYIEVDRKAEVGDYAISDKNNVFKVNFSYDDGVSNGALFYYNCYYRTLEPTDIVNIAGIQYKIAERKAEVGEGVLVVNPEDLNGDGYSIGDIFVVEESYEDSPWVDSEGGVTLFHREYRVLIPVDSKPAEPTPDIHDLLANLAQRVTSLERITGELVRAKSSLESQLRDTQNNVQTFAEQTEANTKDIKFLDDRTFEKPGKPTKSAEEILREISKILERDERQ